MHYKKLFRKFEFLAFCERYKAFRFLLAHPRPPKSLFIHPEEAPVCFGFYSAGM
jgi:hypothetical protein